MTENTEFIPYQEAISLKNLGFNDPCDAVYDPQGQLKNDENTPILEENGVFAPTFQQSFLFFKEKYRIFSEISIQSNGICGFFISKTVDKGQKSYPINRESEAHTDTELSCLRSLIEMAKNSQKYS
jgi:hypothetical protein